MLHLTVLCDALASAPGFRPSAGFSCLLQMPHKNVLFDTGPHISTLLHNMQALSLHPLDIGAIVLSHNDSDHSGALFDLLSTLRGVEVHVLESSPAQYKQRIARAAAVVKEVRSPTEIAEGLTSTGELGDSPSEQSLIIATSTGPALVIGCSHPGPAEIVQKATETAGVPPYLVAGGFHLEGATGAEIEAAAHELKLLGVKQVAPCHCTGNRARQILHSIFGDNCIKCGSGQIVELG